MLKITDTATMRRFVAKFTVCDGCWVWNRATQSDGYGHVCWGGQNLLAHRISYATFVGSIPEGLELHHECGNKACVRPDHLTPMTHLMNIKQADGIAGGAHNFRGITHCLRGHEFTEENTYIRPSGGRRCRQCDRARRHAREHQTS